MRVKKFDLVKCMWWYQKVRNKLRTLSGALPLSFKAKAGALKDYRIYGQTSRNLFDYSTIANGFRITWATGAQVADDSAIMSDYIPISKGIYRSNASFHLIGYDANKNYIGTYNSNTKSFAKEYGSKTSWYELTDSDIKFVRLMSYSSTDTIVENTMFCAGSTVIPYEPYGESVGDRTGNLFDKTRNTIPNTILQAGTINAGDGYLIYAPINPLQTYTFRTNGTIRLNLRSAFTINEPAASVSYVIDGVNTHINHNADKEFTRQAPLNANWIVIQIRDESALAYDNMLNLGSTALPYEPYGYKVPVTVSNGTDTLTTPIYLPEQIKKVGDEAEYIDYGEQKQYFADGTSVDVTLPALPILSGTNTLSVGTEVQPSSVEIKGRIKAIDD